MEYTTTLTKHVSARPEKDWAVTRDETEPRRSTSHDIPSKAEAL
ncbi:hypothetical protein [Arthrobacter sp. ISL-95]|nr:hypothetical protein [Arthrobacter sp. ISL-95]